MMYKKILLIMAAIVFVLAAVSCEPEPNETPEPSEMPDPIPTETASIQTTPASSPKATPQPTPAPTPTETPEPTPEVPDSVGSGDVLFDIYQYKTSRDLNFDGIDEEIEFFADEAESRLIINGTEYIVSHPNLAQLFAITDVNADDDILEIVFTDKYDAELSDGEFPFSWLYWWNNTEIIRMGGLMDVKFAGEWRSGFLAFEHFDSNNMVMCMTDTDTLTYLLYMGHYKPSGDDRKLKEIKYAAVTLGDKKKIKCKKPVLLLEKLTSDYFSSEFDYYWIPTIWPYTAGRVPHVCDGVEIIAQPGEWLTIEKVYGKSWFKMSTSDGYSGWMKLLNGGPMLDPTVGWTLSDVFSGL